MAELTKHEFYFETPLYEIIDRESADPLLFSGEVDAYSSVNKIDTTYTVSSFDMRGYRSTPSEVGFRRIELKCKRKNNDELTFFVLVSEQHCTKVGQWPSLVDLQFAELGKKYDKHMGKSNLQEFKRAIGLSAHGVGVGSFVYLRRIFSNLIDEAFEANKEKLSLTKEDFYKLRMAERVALLEVYLPSQLVEMKGAYSVLSKGIHELTEEECRAYFKVVKLAIELILDQKIEEDAQKMRNEAVRKQLAQLESELKPKQVTDKS